MPRQRFLRPKKNTAPPSVTRDRTHSGVPALAEIVTDRAKRDPASLAHPTGYGYISVVRPDAAAAILPTQEKCRATPVTRDWRIECGYTQTVSTRTATEPSEGANRGAWSSAITARVRLPSPATPCPFKSREWLGGTTTLDFILAPENPRMFAAARNNVRTSNFRPWTWSIALTFVLAYGAVRAPIRHSCLPRDSRSNRSWH